MADAALYAQALAQIGPAMAKVRDAKGEARLYATSTLVRLIGTAAANAPTAGLRLSWQVQYRALVAQEAALPVPDYGRPAAWLQALDRFSDYAIQVGQDILSGLAGTVKTLPKLANALPWLTLVALVLAAVVLVKVGPALVPSLKGRK